MNGPWGPIFIEFIKALNIWMSEVMDFVLIIFILEPFDDILVFKLYCTYVFYIFFYIYLLFNPGCWQYKMKLFHSQAGCLSLTQHKLLLYFISPLFKLQKFLFVWQHAIFGTELRPMLRSRTIGQLNKLYMVLQCIFFLNKLTIKMVTITKWKFSLTSL